MTKCWAHLILIYLRCNTCMAYRGLKNPDPQRTQWKETASNSVAKRGKAIE